MDETWDRMVTYKLDKGSLIRLLLSFVFWVSSSLVCEVDTMAEAYGLVVPNHIDTTIEDNIPQVENLKQVRSEVHCFQT